MCTACQNQAYHLSNKQSSEPYNKEVSHWGELSSIAGDVSRVQKSKFNIDPAIIIPQFSDITGLGERTDIVFESIMSNNYLYHKPGDVIVFILGSQLLETVHIHYRLSEIDEQLTEIQTVVEQDTIEDEFHITLPTEEKVLYLLSIEAMTTSDEVIDTAIYLVEVVPQVINAKLALDETIFTAEARIKAQLELTNFGPNQLYFGHDYMIELYEDGQWYTLHFENMAFTSQLTHSEPGEVFTLALRLPTALPQGQYRVVKSIEARGVSTDLKLFEGVNLAVEFEIK